MEETDKEFRRLKKRTEDHQKLLDQERERKKPMPNARMEEDTPDRLKRFDFWCSVCQEDFEASCHKTRHRLGGDWIAVWRARCPWCEEGCLRHITHKDEDPYYRRSDKVRRQRNQYAAEMLQAEDFGFKTHYGQPYPEFIKRMQKNERKIIEEQREQGLKGWSLESKEKLRTLLRVA